MINNILFYRWGSTCEMPLMKQLSQLNISYVEFERKIQNYHADSVFAEEILKVIHSRQISAVFSFDYFPLISMICEINHIPYITWIYDCPMLTLQSKTLGNDSNYIFCFDRIYAERLSNAGAKHCVHFPLGGNGELFLQLIEKENGDEQLIRKYSCDISFLGNLYNENKNRYRKAKFRNYTKGFLEGLIESQTKIYGYNFIGEVLPNNIVEEMKEACDLNLGEMYYQDIRQMAADVLNMEITAREREQVLKRVSTEFQIMLYTGSVISDGLKQSNVVNKGYADYEKEMPFIFHNSKINLNITSKSIESGVPLRVFDIISCGGFCLTNYQPEIAELFEDGKELIMYTDMDDLMNKVKYYLSHDEERKEIARNGYEKLLLQHTLADRVKDIFY